MREASYLDGRAKLASTNNDRWAIFGRLSSFTGEQVLVFLDRLLI
jgi:hypothetical protein